MSKTPPKPKAPGTVPAVSTNTGFGSAQYKNGQYNYSTDTDPQAKANLQSAQTGFGGQLQGLQNPNAAMAQARQTAYDAQVPAFERQASIGQAAATAGLGNRYFSTFGQLDANDVAQQNAIKRAQLGQQVYNAGNEQLNTLYGFADRAGQLATAAQGNRQAPYEALGNLTAQGQPGVSNMNATNSSNFGTVAGMRNTDANNKQAQTNAMIAASQPNISVVP